RQEIRGGRENRPRIAACPCSDGEIVLRRRRSQRRLAGPNLSRTLGRPRRRSARALSDACSIGLGGRTPDRRLRAVRKGRGAHRNEQVAMGRKEAKNYVQERLRGPPRRLRTAAKLETRLGRGGTLARDRCR